MAYEAEAKDCSEMTADRISFTQNQKTSDRELVRGWKTVDGKRKQSVLDFLNSRLTITGPKYDSGKAVADGVWRVVNAVWDDTRKMYLETLRFGWATTLKWDEVRITRAEDNGPAAVPVENVTHAEVILTITVPNVAYGSSQAIISALVGTHTNPTIQGVQRSGTWTCNGATAIERPQDGCHDIQAVLFFVTAYSVAPKTVSDTVFETVTEQQLFGQSDVPSVTVTSGVMKMISAAIDKFKKWRVELRTTTSKYSQITFTVSPRLGYTETHIITRNQMPAEGGGPVLPTPAVGYINDYVGSPSRNPNGTWNWYLVIRPDDSLLPDNGTGTINKYSYQLRKQPWSPSGDLMINEKSDIYWFKSLTVHQFVYKVYASAAAAWSAKLNGYPISDKPVHIGYGRWMVVFAYEFQNSWTKTGDMAEYRGGE